ncbi:MAG: thioredoxin-disulfide reductase [Oscillospiraceae bacterium]
MTDILIIGAGPAGLTAAIYGARAGLSVLVFDKNMYGGQIILTSDVENYPSIQKISGPDLAINLYSHATSLGVEVRFEEVTSVDLKGKVKTVTTPQGVYEGHTVIVASGASRRHLGCPGEEEFVGRGVSYCATCDAAFFKGKDVAIVGGGSTALEDALFLSNHCNKVVLIHRRDSFRGEKLLQDAIKKRDNIEVLYSSTVSSIQGGNTVESCVVNTPEGEKAIPISGIFVAIGLVPETGMFSSQIEVNAEGYFVAGEDCATSLPGVFVAGDLRAKPLRQIITAASDGAVAAVAAATAVSAAAVCGIS